MDSSAALHLRGAGPIFLRPVIRNPARAARWSAWLVAEAAAPRSVLPLKPRRIDLGMRFILFLVTSQSVKGCGQRRGRGRGKSKGGTCRGCKRRQGCEGNATTVVTPQKNRVGLDSWCRVPPSETKVVASSCETAALPARRKAKPRIKSKARWADPLDPKAGGQSQRLSESSSKRR